jgi:hypothetical protein
MPLVKKSYNSNINCKSDSYADRATVPGVTAETATYLLKVGISDLLQWLNLIDRNQVTAQAHTLNANLFERTLC